DFLQRYVVEVRPGPPAELLLWPREGFTPPNGIAPPGKTTNGMSEALWIEAALGADGPVSACEVDSRRWKVRWDTGAEAALIVRSPEALGRAKKTGDWTLRCAGHTIATQLEPLSPDSEAPGTDLIVGMPLLSRGPVFFDLPHGRVWFRKQGLLAELPENRSGLELRYVDKRGERQLVVAAIRKGSPAEALRKAGLKPGDVIEELDSRPATELDLWEVERRLGGVYGDTVTLLWGSEKSVKVVPLKVR
ncbi:MAG: hypothetical protein NDJ90_09335, partial [Oligoflexia bacterium]|nr:hypothetical protein [Oligoflexia bacterium]